MQFFHNHKRKPIIEVQLCLMMPNFLFRWQAKCFLKSCFRFEISTKLPRVLQAMMIPISVILWQQASSMATEIMLTSSLECQEEQI